MNNIVRFFSIAALVATGAILSGCSKKEVEEPEIRSNSDNIVTVTTTINLDENEATKALAIDYDARTLTKTFAVGDKIAVIYHNKSGNLDKAESVALTESDLFGGGKSAKITVTLTNPKAYESVRFIYPASMAGTDDVDYSKLKNQTGTLAGIAASLDLATFEGSLDGWYRLPSSVKLENEFAIIAYTLKNETGANDITGTITGMTINDGTNGYTISGRDSDGRIYAAIRPTSHADIKYFATNGTKNYNKSVTDKTYEAGEFYQLGLRMAEASFTDLSTIIANYTAADGETLYGTLAGNYKISIAAGATVMLKDVTIDGSGNYAGINCMGDATIILDGTNNVKGYSSDYPGIYVPRYKTLTILGTGSLTAIGNGCGAGIGGRSDAYSGNIVIEGGTITATGGLAAAGIGGGYGYCGNITISGGTVTATGGDKAAGIGTGSDGTCGSITISGGTVTAPGGDEAAGIGSGWYGSCGNITITEGVTSVTATKGFDAVNSIGAGYQGSYGTVSIGGNVGAISKSPYTFPVITDLSTVDGNYTALNLETLTGTLAGNYMISIAAGATVTLKDMTIGGTDNSDCQWAGITCEGDATIILEGTNSVEGSSYYYPGIHVPRYKTLTILGTGSLTAIGKGGGSGIGGIGVSDGNRSYCGNITIEGGIITATAGEYAAGIGGGKNCNCGNITITGGTVTAHGGTKSAGIGSSMGSDCGNIRITDGVTKVTVYSGSAYAIGPGYNGSCGSVRIGGNSGGVAGSPYIYQP